MRSATRAPDATHTPEDARARRGRPEQSPDTARPTPWLSPRSTFAQALLGGALLWLALPPADLGLLAWLAPLPWLRIVQRGHLAGRRPYFAFWLAGLLFWLATLHWLTLPHWATGFGWVALSAYLAAYLPLFVGLTRVAVHRLRCPLPLAAAIIWTGLELFRGHFLSGFLMGALAHTQHGYPLVIQVCDLAGAYGLSFAMMFVAAGVAAALPHRDGPFDWRPLLPAAALLSGLLAYGQWRLGESPDVEPSVDVALIQGSIDTEFKPDPGRGLRIFNEYLGLTRQALAERPETDLVVWPETMFSWPLIAESPNAEDVARSREAIAYAVREMQADRAGRPHWLAGIDVQVWSAERNERYNSALLISPQGELLGRYDKMHPVMFGEYVPFGETFPWLYGLTPLGGGLSAGEAPQAFEVGGLLLAPNVCYETVVPHLVRRQVRDLSRAGREPDVLVNLTNDGWFWGSAELDMHLANGVFRAVECRKPLLIAANTGFSAWIDDRGRLLAKGPRRARGIVYARIGDDESASPYVRWGDWFAWLCLAGCGVAAAVGCWDRRR